MKIFTTLTFLIVLCFSINSVWAQSGNISCSGKLTDENGRPLANVRISIRNTKYAAETDTEGRFTFHIPAGTYTVAVKLLGYKPYEKRLNLQEPTTIENIRLVSDIRNLDEVKVQGKTDARIVKEKPFYVSTVEANEKEIKIAANA